MRGSSEPRTAIQAAAGAIPNDKPSTRCDQRVKRLVYEYSKTTANATGERRKANRFSWKAASTKIPQETATNVETKAGLSVPAGRARAWVRGFAASIAASARRLKAMAAERAETMAMMIQANWRRVGNPPAASMAPHNAKGSAKIECSHLIISSVTRRSRSKAIPEILTAALGHTLQTAIRLIRDSLAVPLAARTGSRS